MIQPGRDLPLMEELKSGMAGEEGWEVGKMKRLRGVHCGSVKFVLPSESFTANRDCSTVGKMVPNFQSKLMDSTKFLCACVSQYIKNLKA